jgi:hypothetical protein
VWTQLREAETIEAATALLDKAGLRNVLEPVSHVAIDRFTGGAAEHLLYSELQVRALTWNPIEFTLDVAQLERAGPTVADGSAGLLLLALRSLQAGDIRFGYATMRGGGGIDVKRIAIRSYGTHRFSTLATELLDTSDDRYAEVAQGFVSSLLRILDAKEMT